MRGALAVLALAATLLVPAHAAEELRIPPADEAAGDLSWLQFRNRLLAAVEKRDRKYVLSILDPKIRTQSEKTRGIAEFRKQWDIDAPDTPLWRELSSALQLGAAFIKRDNRSELCAPYLLARWPEDVEPFDHGAIVSRAAVVQAEPSASAPALGELSYHVVRVLDWEVADKSPDAAQKWVRIHYGARDGYVPEEQVRSAVEHTACFVKTPAGWRMTAFAPAGGE